MAPIVSPKLLTHIMTHGHTIELCRASYVKMPYANLRARPVAVCKATALILGSAPRRQRKELAPCSHKVSYTNLPNSTFIVNSGDCCSVSYLTEEEISPVSGSETISLLTLDSGDEDSEQAASAIAESTNSFEIHLAIESAATHLSSIPFAAPSTSSLTYSCEPPSIAATLISPCKSSKSVRDPLSRLRAQPGDHGYYSVASMGTARHRQASEAPYKDFPNVSIPYVRKCSDVGGLRRLRLWGLHIFKKIK